jgi:Tfp pilus assembly protein PilF
MDASKLITAALALCLVATSAPAQSSGRTVRHHRVAQEESATSALIREAEAALDKQDWATAETKLKGATAAAPNDYQAWFYLGYLYTQTQRLDLAADAYRHSVSAKADLFESNLNLGLVLARRNDPEAERYLRAATQLKPTARVDEGKARAWVSLARFLESSKPQDAIAAYGEAAKLRPKDAEPHVAMGALLERQKKYPEAAAEFRQALALDPKSNEALAGLVNTATEQKDFAGAEAMLRKYLEAEPSNAGAHLQLGRLLAAQKKYPEATAELEGAAAATPGDLRLSRELAAAYAGSGHWEKAAPLYEKLIQVQPRDAELQRIYGVALLHQQRYSEAQEHLILAVNTDPKLTDAYGDLAVAAAENKNYDLSLKALDARARFLPESPATLYLRATNLDNLHLFKDASEYYKTFLQAAPGQFPDLEWKARHRLKAIDPKSR